MLLRLLLLSLLLLASCVSRNTVKLTKSPANPPGISYSGGSGESFHDAVEINGARDKSSGVSAEYNFISEKHGIRGTDWYLVGQTVIREKNKIVDVVEIQVQNTSDRRIFYFDVSGFLGKKE